MDPSYIKPFIASIQNVFSTMLQLPVSIKDPFIKTGSGTSYDVSGIIGMTGEVTGSVVLAAGDRQIGLMVGRLIGQQEVVVKPLDVSGRSNKAVSGATVRDDGGVSLIVDVNEVFRLAED